jgi:hypothetical protein
MMEPDKLSPEDLQSILWDITEECINGRTEGHKCPFCTEGSLVCTVVEGVSIRLECEGCRKVFDGRIG